MQRPILSLWGRHPSLDYTSTFPQKPHQLQRTLYPIPNLPPAGDVAQLLPGAAWQGEG
jgi:hypothetical protein